MSGFDEYGLYLENVTMSELDLYNIVQPLSDSLLRYFKLNNVVIGSLKSEGATEDSEDCCQINVQDYKPHSAHKGLSINNSKIGFIEKNSLSFFSNSKLDFRILNSEIGVVKEKGIKLGKAIYPNFENSSFTLEDGAFEIGNNIEKQILNNRIVMSKTSFASWDCESKNIGRNKIILVEELKAIRALEENELDSGLGTTSAVHPSCLSGNQILNANLDPPTTTTTSTVTPSSTTVTTETPDPAIANNSMAVTLPGFNSSESFQQITDGTEGRHDSENYYQIHKYLCYLVAAVVGFLLIILIGLVAALAMKQKEAGRKRKKPEEDRHPSLMYMPGSSVYGNDTWPIPSASTFDM